MQATGWTPSDPNANLAAHRAVPARGLGWYVAFAVLTTLAETLFLLSSMPCWTAG